MRTRTLNITATVAASATVALGAATIAGWHLGVWWLVQPIADLPATSYEAALCLTLAGIALLWFIAQRVWHGLLFVGLAAALVIAALLRWSFTLDVPVLHLAGASDLLSGSRSMSVLSAAAIGMVLLAMTILGTFNHRIRAGVAAVISSVVMAFGVMGLADVVLGLPFPLSDKSGMSVFTAVGLVLLSIGVVWLSLVHQRMGEASVPRWLPLALGMGVFSGAFALWLSIAGQIEQADPIAWADAGRLTLLIGLVLAVLVGLTAHLAQLAASKARRMAELNDQLRAEIRQRTDVEHDLRGRTRELEDFFDSAAVGLHVVDAQGVVLRANQAELEMLGYAAEELIGQHIGMVHANSAVAEDVLIRLHRGQELRDFEADLRCKDGSLRHVLLDSNVLWEDGRFVQTRCFVRDITERTQRERAMQRLVECARFSGTQFSQAIVQSLSELLGVRHAMLAQLTSDGDGAQVLAMCCDGCMCHEGKVYELEGTPCENVIKGRTCSYSDDVAAQFPRDTMLAELNIESYVGTPLRSSSGDAIGLLAVLHDRRINPRIKPGTMLELFADRAAAELERQLSERALRSSQEQLSAMFNQVAVGIVQCRLDGKIVFANQRFVEIAGRTSEQLAGANMVELAHAEDQAVLKQELARLGHGMSGLISEVRMVRPDGSIVWVNNSLSLVTDGDGRPNFAVAVTMDVTLRKQAEMALQLLSGTSGLVSASIDFEQALTKVARLAVPEFADWCAVHVVEDDGLVRQTTVALDPSNSQMCLELRRAYRLDASGTSDVAAALRSGQGELRYAVDDAWVTSVAGPDQVAVLGGRPIRSAMTVPMGARGRTIGAMTFVTADSGRRFDSRDLLLGQELARRCALAVDNARLYRDLTHRVNELQTLLDVLPVGICIAADAECRTMTMNAATARLFGMDVGLNPSKNHVDGRHLPFKVCRYGEEVPADALPMQRAAATGTVLRGVELDVVRADGTVAHASVDAAPLLDDMGRIRGSVGVMMDVTERAKADRRLAAEHAIARILAESGNLDHAAPRVLESVCHGLGFHVGGLWRPNAAGTALECTQMWSRAIDRLDPFVRRSRDITFEPGRGLPGRVWVSGAAAWIDDVVNDENFPRAPVADQAGLHSGVAFPIVSGDEFLGVMEFFAPQVIKPDQRLLDMMSAVGHDIGQFVQRTRVEQALRESEQRFRSMADAAPVLIWLAGPDQGCTYVNQSWREFTGAEPVVGQGRPHWRGLVHPADAEQCEQVFGRAFAARQPLQLEYRLRHCSGAYRWVLESAVPRLSIDGDLLGYIGSCVDISAIKEAEMGLRARARQQRTIARIGQRALIESDLTSLLQETAAHLGRALRVPTTAVFELLPDKLTLLLRGGAGWEDGAIGRVSVGALELDAGSELPKGGRALVVKNWAQESDVPWPESLRKRGFTSVACVPIDAGDRRFGMLCAMSTRARTFSRGDVHFLQAASNVLATAIVRHRAGQELDRYRRHLETLVAERTAALESSHEQLRMAERSASLGTLATGLGHDIGNLVLPILCRLDFLAAQKLPEPAVPAIDAVRDSVVRLRQLANGLRLFTLDPADAQASAGVTHLHRWWQETGPLLGKALPRQVELQSELPNELPSVAMAAHQLTQAMMNLVTNAGEAITGRGLVRVWAKANSDRKFINVGVTDNGQGMSEEVRRHAFEPFFTTKKRSLSTGLGLSLVHAVVQQVGGTISIHSKPGHGTTIVMQLPVAAVEASGGDPPSASRLARVDVGDVRVASLAIALLRSSGFNIADPLEASGNGESGKPPALAGENHHETLWIVDPATASLQTVRMFLGERPGRRVIVIGPADPQWEEPGVVVVDGSYRAMRHALQQASGHEPAPGDLAVEIVRRREPAAMQAADLSEHS